MNMAESQNLSVQLARALRDRDDARKHAAAEEQLAAADGEVDRVKDLIRDRLADISVEIDHLRLQASAQQVRYKTGEYTEAQYRNATAEDRRRIASLERLEESFGVLLEAETEADVRHTSGRPAASVTVTSPASVHEMARKEAAPVRRYFAGTKGWRGIPAPRWMLIGSGALIAVGAVALVVLLAQAAFGSFDLPSLPGLFRSDGGTTAPSPTSAVTTAPMTTVAPAGAEFQVPVQLRGAQVVGSIYVQLDYDPAAVEVLRVDAAALPSGTLFEYGLGQGRVSLGAVSSNGLTGDWTVAFITCRRASGASTSGDSTISVSEVQAHRATDLAGISAYGTNGHVNLSSLAVAAPTVTFG